MFEFSSENGHVQKINHVDLKGCKNKMYVEQLGEPVPEAAEAQLGGGVHDQHDHDHPPRLPSEQLVDRNPNIISRLYTQGYGRLYLSSDQL